MTAWYPFGVRESGDYEAYDALSEGVPPWIRMPLLNSLVEAFEDPSNVYDELAAPLVRACNAAIRDTLPESNYSRSFSTALEAYARETPTRFLTVLDWRLAVDGRGASSFRSQVEGFLAAGNSAWSVGEWGDGHTGLVRRVDSTTAAAAAQAISAKTSASQHIADAWQAAYGLNGDPSKAYSHAIKAVEFAAIPVVAPSNHTATLGSVIGQIRADGDWVLPLTREKSTGHVAGMLLSMLESLWTGQSDRHGSSLPPLTITSEAAQAAVLMATTLVQWFQSGAVQRGTI